MGKKLSGARKNFFCDPVPVTYSYPWSHESRPNFPGPQKFFSTILSRHIFEPLVPRKPTKLSGAPKVFFHDPVPGTYSNPWSYESRPNFPGPQKFFSTILSPSHIRTPGPTKADQTFWGPKSSSSHAHTGTNTHLPTRPPDLDNFLFQPEFSRGAISNSQIKVTTSEIL